jgi:hypothetical protein
MTGAGQTKNSIHKEINRGTAMATNRFVNMFTSTALSNFSFAKGIDLSVDKAAETSVAILHQIGRKKLR